MGLCLLKPTCMQKIAFAQVLRDEGAPKVKAWRLALALSKEELARRLDVPIGVIDALEAQGDPVPDALEAVASALGISRHLMRDPYSFGDLRSLLYRAQPSPKSMERFFLTRDMIEALPDRMSYKV